MTLYFFSILKKYFPSPVEIDLNEPKRVQDIFLEQLGKKQLDVSYLKFVRYAVDCEYVSGDTLVKDCREIAFIPPVSGG
ncbi:MAG: MoaD/ThiS family protein [Deltaproteobacteria bacterium]|nr:MAG: MoaD/ThiS family protein [Deltaproteobacteria bacterium]